MEPASWSDEDARVAPLPPAGDRRDHRARGLDRLVERARTDAADRVLPALADTLRRHARGADHVARLGAGRFGVLLPETGEVEAINYVERVRQACELWLESGAIALQLAIGWASPRAETEPRRRGRRAPRSGCSPSCAATRDGSRSDIAIDGAPVHDLEGSPSPA